MAGEGGEVEGDFATAEDEAIEFGPEVVDEEESEQVQTLLETVNAPIYYLLLSGRSRPAECFVVSLRPSTSSHDELAGLALLAGAVKLRPGTGLLLARRKVVVRSQGEAPEIPHAERLTVEILLMKSSVLDSLYVEEDVGEDSGFSQKFSEAGFLPLPTDLLEKEAELITEFKIQSDRPKRKKKLVSPLVSSQAPSVAGDDGEEAAAATAASRLQTESKKASAALSGPSAMKATFRLAPAIHSEAAGMGVSAADVARLEEMLGKPPATAREMLAAKKGSEPFRKAKARPPGPDLDAEERKGALDGLDAEELEEEGDMTEKEMMMADKTN